MQFSLKLIIGGLPCFGPAFLHFKLLGTQQYFGRVLISIETELVPPETENNRNLFTDNIVSFPNEVVISIQ